MRYILSLLILWLTGIFSSLNAQAIFINKVRIYKLFNVELKQCNVKFDSNGNLFISAPDYEIKSQNPPNTTNNVNVTVPGGVVVNTGVKTVPAGGGAIAVGSIATPGGGIKVNTGVTGASNSQVKAQVQVNTAQVQTQVVTPQPQIKQTHYYIYTQGSPVNKVPFYYQIEINKHPINTIKHNNVGLAVDITQYLKKGGNIIKITATFDDSVYTENGNAADTFKIKLITGMVKNGALEPQKTLLQFVKNASEISSMVKEFQIIVD